YRAVAKALLDAGHSPEDHPRARAAAQALDPSRFDEAALKAQAVGAAASLVSAIPEVRSVVLAFQRDFGRTAPGAVLDGRDIGTASPEVRARRRAVELEHAGDRIDEAEVLADIRRRDERDSTRTIAPLKAAPDAYLLDTTHLDIDAAFRAAIDIVEAVRAGRKR